MNRKVMTPDYKRLYSDMVEMKYPDKQIDCINLLSKKTLSVLDVISLEEIIFGSNEKQKIILNQKHRSYDKNSIFEILEYQKKNGMNNSQLAKYFKLSRNTITKWKRLFYSVDSGSMPFDKI